MFFHRLSCYHTADWVTGVCIHIFFSYFAYGLFEFPPPITISDGGVEGIERKQFSCTYIPNNTSSHIFHHTDGCTLAAQHKQRSSADTRKKRIEKT